MKKKISYYKSNIIEGDNHGTINNIFEKVDISHVEQLVEELHAQIGDKSTLEIIVLTSTQSDYEQEHNEEIPLEKYGEKPENWKPYRNEKEILELLAEFQLKSLLKLNIFFLNQHYWEDSSWKTDIKEDIASNTILIVDIFSLIFEENRKFALLFDYSKIGGFLVPMSYDLSEKQKTYARGLFSHFETVKECWESRFHKNYMFIDLEIPQKFLLFRRLADIAFKHLGKTEAKSKRTALSKKYENAKEAKKLL